MSFNSAEYMTNWRNENIDKVRQYARDKARKIWGDPVLREKEKIRQRNKHYRKKYGITIAEYDLMLKAQGGRCAICGAEKHDSRGYRLAVDHDHKTGVVRGLLCRLCNLMIAKYSKTALAKAAKYLSEGGS